MANYTAHDLAIEGATQKFHQIAQDPGLLDGEIVLYRYTINNASEIHTIVGVVCEKDGNKYIEFLGNYDVIKHEIQTYVDNTLLDLDSVVEGSDENNQITVKVTQVDGVLASVNVESNIDVSSAIEELVATLNGTASVAEIEGNTLTIYKSVKENNGIISSDTNKITLTFADVAFSGAAEDVSVADSDNVIAATTVEGALVEIAKEIDAMTMTESSVVALAIDGSALNYSNIKQENGQVKITDKQQLIKFNTAYNAENNLVATMSDITTAVNNAGYTAGTNVTIDSDRKINVPLGLVYDSTNKEIKLTQGINEDATVIDTIDATDFIKDGMLNKAELVDTDADGKTGKFIKLTWNTDAGLEDVYIDVTEFIDTYTNGNKWIKVDSYKIYHELSNVMSNPAENETKTTDGPALSTNTPGFGSSFSFKIPSLTIDAAGHVQAVSTNEVSITLPNLPDFQGMIDGIKNFSSIQIVDGESITATTNADTLKIKGDDEIKLAVAEGQVTINHTQHTPETIETTDVTSELNQTATVISVPVYSFNESGHMIKSGTQKYKLTVPESNVTTVEAGNGIDLEDNVEEDSNNHNYKVSVKLNPNTNDMLTVDADGLNMSSVWDCGSYM